MILRIVKMQFQADKLDEFLEIFEQSKSGIRQFKGNHEVRLYRDSKQPELMFTYSVWESEEDLNNYRDSEFFLKTWKKTKQLFAAKAEAWSLQHIS